MRWVRGSRRPINTESNGRSRARAGGPRGERPAPGSRCRRRQRCRRRAVARWIRIGDAPAGHPPDPRAPRDSRRTASSRRPPATGTRGRCRSILAIRRRRWHRTAHPGDRESCVRPRPAWWSLPTRDVTHAEDEPRTRPPHNEPIEHEQTLATETSRRVVDDHDVGRIRLDQPQERAGSLGEHRPPACDWSREARTPRPRPLMTGGRMVYGASEGPRNRSAIGDPVATPGSTAEWHRRRSRLGRKLRRRCPVPYESWE